MKGCVVFLTAITIGMFALVILNDILGNGIDTAYALPTAADCRLCHDNPDIVEPPTNVDRHHLLYGTPIGDPNSAPFADPPADFDCFSCHAVDCSTGVCNVSVERDCTVCHGAVTHEEQHDMTMTNSPDCLECHVDNVVTEHVTNRGLLCSICHDSLRQDVQDAIIRGINGEIIFCSDCHGFTSHREQHESTNSVCTACHQRNLQDTHNNNCGLCHESTIPEVINAINSGNTDCYACHIAQPHAESCEICHSDKRFSDYIGRSVSIHDKHKDRVICGICHEIPQSIDFGSQNNACGNLCHGGKDYDRFQDIHKKHMGKFNIMPNPCNWCHGLSVPQRPDNICLLCHRDESGGSDVAHDKHAEKFDCTACHESVTGFGPDVRFDASRQVCRFCHSPESDGPRKVHNKHVFDEAQCYVCHGDSNVYASFRGDKDCTICHYTKSGSFQRVHKKHAGNQMMCTVCHSIVPPNVEGIQGYETGPPPPQPENEPPLANAGDDQAATVGQAVYFDGSQSHDSDGTIVSHEWDFGDGSSATGVTAVHSYSYAATFTVTLTVVDDDGAVDNDTLLIAVTEIPAEHNLALNKPASASDYEYSYTPSNAVDGSMSTRWLKRSKSDEWLRVDLGSVYRINRVVIHWHNDYAEDYNIYVSTYGGSWFGSWSRIKEVRSGNGGIDELTFSGRDARYIFIEFKKPRDDDGYSIYEFEVYGQ